MNIKGAKPGQRHITTSPGEGLAFSSTTVLERKDRLRGMVIFLTQMPQLARRTRDRVRRKP